MEFLGLRVGDLPFSGFMKDEANSLFLFHTVFAGLREGEQIINSFTLSSLTMNSFRPSLISFQKCSTLEDY